MKNSVKSLLNKLQGNKNGTLSDGFKVLKGIRGGILLADNSGAECTNSGASCSGVNKHYCTNSKDCTGTTNSAICSNGTCIF